MGAAEALTAARVSWLRTPNTLTTDAHDEIPRRRSNFVVRAVDSSSSQYTKGSLTRWSFAAHHFVQELWIAEQTICQARRLRGASGISRACTPKIFFHFTLL
jgi:hypothetical protein